MANRALVQVISDTAPLLSSLRGTGVPWQSRWGCGGGPWCLCSPSPPVHRDCFVARAPRKDRMGSRAVTRGRV